MKDKTLIFIFSFIVKEENQARYEEVLAKQLEITKKEPGTLIYEIFKDENGVYCQHERYADEAACLKHVQNTSVQLQEWMQLTDVKQTIALGPISNTFKEQFALKEHYLPYAKVNK